jgi:hypothetical protein
MCGMTMTSIEWVRSLPDVGVKDISLGENRRRRLHGKPASPGRYTGTVRVIHSEAEFDRLRAGDVLVCPVVLPVWTVLFPHVGALVTDSGGILSNPAIVARECGVPQSLPPAWARLSYGTANWSSSMGPAGPWRSLDECVAR